MHQIYRPMKGVARSLPTEFAVYKFDESLFKIVSKVVQAEVRP